MKPFLIALLMLFSMLAGAAHITDKLVVGLYADKELGGEPLQLLTSGTPVEVLQEGKGVLRVRLADDTRGWLETRYVSEEKPAAMKLLEAQAELRTLRSRLDPDGTATAAEPGNPTASAERVYAGLALNKAKARIAELEAQLGDLPRLVEAGRELEQARERLARIHALVAADGASGQALRETPAFWRPYLAWGLGGLMAVLGFVSGVAFIGYRIRRRYGDLHL